MSKIIIKGHDSYEIIDTDTTFIARERNGELFVTGSNTWTCRGFCLLNNFGKVVESLTVKEFYNRLISNKDSLFYKNGKARFEVTDLDHGTKRVWGSRPLKHEVSFQK